jgi:asparagine synthase (glutamine-hydrolysing)
MCGICGIYNLDGRPVERDLLARMNSTLIHRGPDDEGYYINKNVGLGHRRLSIIDLNTGQQPIYNEDKSNVIVFNGEIYNFLELKSELEKEGHFFRTRTDTEVILHGYEQWGADCVSHLRGMFAFAIWDKRKKSVFLARDRLGKKPLYYYANGIKILFASELKAIIEDGTIPREINIEALSDYLSLGYVPAPKTIFKGIYKLLPGHTLLYKNGNLILRKYWDVNFQPKNDMSMDQFCEQIVETLKESVKMRLVSDVPLGAFLSGGIDSSAIVGLMASLKREPVITNSIGFTEKEFNELGYAKETAEYFKTDHREYTVSPDAVDIVRKLSWHFDEPFADSSSIPTYYVSKMTRQSVTVALSGDGGDENFGGYRRYYFDRLENEIRNFIPQPIRRYLIGNIARLYPKADWLPQVFRAKTLLTNISKDPIDGYFNSMSLFLPPMKEKLLSGDFKANLKGYDSAGVFRDYYNNSDTDDPLSRTQYIDFKTYLVDDILTKVDRASMANSLEVRVPLLDHKFVELVAQIPSNLKLNGRTSKYIFRKALAGILPDGIMDRKKWGFGIPVGKWLRKEIRETAEETLFNQRSDAKGFFNQKYVRWLWDQHLSGMRDFSQPLWTLLMFQLWADRFM